MFKFKFVEGIFVESLYIYVANKQLNRCVAFDFDGEHVPRHARGRRGERVHLVGREQIGLWYCIALEIVVVVLETVYGPLYVS